MKVTLNGKEAEFQDGISLREMLDELDNHNKMIVIEKNLEIVPKEKFSETFLKEGDTIEVISFVGGG